MNRIGHVHQIHIRSHRSLIELLLASVSYRVSRIFREVKFVSSKLKEESQEN